jgi:hypothetical protein
MACTRTDLVAFLALATLLLLTVHPMTTTSQAVDELQPRFGQALVLVQQAESAGATSSEVGELTKLLNSALALNEEALKLTSPSDVQKRAGLLAQVDQILASVEAKAVQLQAVAARRTYTNTVLAYVYGVIAAFLGTIACAYGVFFYRRYRTKRAFQMRISPK